MLVDHQVTKNVFISLNLVTKAILTISHAPAKASSFGCTF